MRWSQKHELIPYIFRFCPGQGQNTKGLAPAFPIASLTISRNWRSDESPLCDIRSHTHTVRQINLAKTGASLCTPQFLPAFKDRLHHMQRDPIGSVCIHWHRSSVATRRLDQSRSMDFAKCRDSFAYTSKPRSWACLPRAVQWYFRSNRPRDKQSGRV